MDLKKTASHAPSNAIEHGGSGDTYPTYWTRLEGIPDPLQGIPIEDSGPPMML